MVVGVLVRKTHTESQRHNSREWEILTNSGILTRVLEFHQMQKLVHYSGQEKRGRER